MKRFLLSLFVIFSIVSFGGSSVSALTNTHSERSKTTNYRGSVVPGVQIYDIPMAQELYLGKSWKTDGKDYTPKNVNTDEIIKMTRRVLYGYYSSLLFNNPDNEFSNSQITIEQYPMVGYFNYAIISGKYFITVSSPSLSSTTNDSTGSFTGGVQQSCTSCSGGYSVNLFILKPQSSVQNYEFYFKTNSFFNNQEAVSLNIRSKSVPNETAEPYKPGIMRFTWDFQGNGAYRYDSNYSSFNQSQPSSPTWYTSQSDLTRIMKQGNSDYFSDISLYYLSSPIPLVLPSDFDSTVNLGSDREGSALAGMSFTSDNQLFISANPSVNHKSGHGASEPINTGYSEQHDVFETIKDMLISPFKNIFSGFNVFSAFMPSDGNVCSTLPEVSTWLYQPASTSYCPFFSEHVRDVVSYPVYFILSALVLIGAFRIPQMIGSEISNKGGGKS